MQRIPSVLRAVSTCTYRAQARFGGIRKFSATKLAHFHASASKFAELEQFKLSEGESDKLKEGRQFVELAEAKLLQGKVDEALVMYDKSNVIYETILGKHNSLSGENYSHMGTACMQMGDYEQSEKYYRKALAILERSLGELHVDTLTTATNYGRLLLFQGKYLDAETILLKLIERYKRVHSTEYHADIANVYHNLGILYKFMRYYDDSEFNFQKANNIYITCCGENDMKVVINARECANMFNEEASADRALEWYNIALRKCEKHDDELEKVRIYEGMCNVYFMITGDLEKALDLVNKCIEVLQRRRDDFYKEFFEHQDTEGKAKLDKNFDYSRFSHIHEVNRLENFLETKGIIYHRMEDYPKAYAFLNEGYRSRMKFLGENNVNLLPTLNRMGAICLTMDMEDKSIELFRKSVQLVKMYSAINEREGKPLTHNIPNSQMVLGLSMLVEILNRKGLTEEANDVDNLQKRVFADEFLNDRPHIPTDGSKPTRIEDFLSAEDIQTLKRLEETVERYKPQLRQLEEERRAMSANPDFVMPNNTDLFETEEFNTNTNTNTSGNTTDGKQ